jgi:hypothetical protein
VVLRCALMLASSASPGNLSETAILGLHPTPNPSETLGVGSSSPCFTKPSR